MVRILLYKKLVKVGSLESHTTRKDKAICHY